MFVASLAEARSIKLDGPFINIFPSFTLSLPDDLVYVGPPLFAGHLVDLIANESTANRLELPGRRAALYPFSSLRLLSSRTW